MTSCSPQYVTADTTPSLSGTNTWARLTANTGTGSYTVKNVGPGTVHLAYRPDSNDDDNQYVRIWDSRAITLRPGDEAVVFLDASDTTGKLCVQCERGSGPGDGNGSSQVVYWRSY